MDKKVLWEDEWLRIVKLDDWYTSYEQVKGDGICVVVINPQTKEVLARWESTLPHGGFNLTSITGLCDKKGEDIVDTAIRELWEEAGIKLSSEQRKQLTYCGWVYPSKASNFKLHRYLLEYTGNVKSKPQGDGTLGEYGSYSKWIPIDQALLEIHCPTMLSLIGLWLISKSTS